MQNPKQEKIYKTSNKKFKINKTILQKIENQQAGYLEQKYLRKIFIKSTKFVLKNPSRKFIKKIHNKFQKHVL